ncbi:MAG: acyl-CoA dehydrogenase [Robiginitomaculum sp.]|nr:MAG: acyl-CoA dehydrogenase [Robiginitomaculum sp.]
MALVLNEEEQMLRDAAKGFLSEKAPVSAFRKLRDDDDPLGWSRALWTQMADMGWAGILVPESYGGIDYGMVGAGLIAQEMGRNLTASPFISTALMAVTALREGTDEQKQKWLPGIATGKTIIAMAVDEGVKHDPAKTALSAVAHGNGYRLNGEKSYIIDGFDADALIVAARTSGEVGDEAGISLFIVEKDAAGMSSSRTKLLDARNYAHTEFKDVGVAGDTLIGTLDDGFALLERVLNVGRVGLAAEMLGASEQSFDMTMDYIKERKQFGTRVGAFQGLQHRSAHLYSEIELVKSAVLKASQMFGESPEMAGAGAALAKAKAGEVAILAANEAVQMHGGIGMTDEYDIGFYMKRVRAAQELLGDYAFQANRLAVLRGF